MFIGYWNRPEETAAKFVGDWLRTGDLGRTDEGGYLWFAGRAQLSAGDRVHRRTSPTPGASPRFRIGRLRRVSSSTMLVLTRAGEGEGGRP